jgi:hypothetical protein
MNIKNIIEKLSLLIDPNQQFITIANIAYAESLENSLAGSSIIMSVINIEEDTVIKNSNIYHRNPNNPTLYNNHVYPKKQYLFTLLFGSYTQSPSHYLEGLVKLQQIMQFFEDNRICYFDITNNSGALLSYASYNQLSVVQQDLYLPIFIDAINLNIDQVNQVWSYLNTKYMPSVIFKLRFIPISTSHIESVGVIEKIKIEQWDKLHGSINNPHSSAEHTKP